MPAPLELSSQSLEGPIQLAAAAAREPAPGAFESPPRRSAPTSPTHSIARLPAPAQIVRRAPSESPVRSIQPDPPLAAPTGSLGHTTAVQQATAESAPSPLTDIEDETPMEPKGKYYIMSIAHHLQ